MTGGWGAAYLLTVSLAASAMAVQTQAASPRIIAVEGAYADIARQIARPDAEITAILTNPASDPHLYEPSPGIARAVSEARIVILNGAGYDAWIDNLLPRSALGIVVASLLHRHPGDNPHLWYDPQAAPALADAVAAALIRADPAGAPGYEARRRTVLASLAVLQSRIAALRTRFAGTPIAATEPVFGLVLQAIGLTDTHARFELAAMNGAEPRASDVAALQDDLRSHRVRALVTNAQASSPASARLRAIAHAAGVPVVPITETLPLGESYQHWLGAELDALEAALSARP